MVEVLIAARHQRGCERYYDTPGGAATPQYGVDECTPDPPVAIGERMDRLELGVYDGGLGQHRDIRSVGKGDQVVHIAGDGLRCRWYVPGDARRVVAATDPVLHAPESARVGTVLWIVDHQRPVRREYLTQLELGPVRPHDAQGFLVGSRVELVVRVDG